MLAGLNHEYGVRDVGVGGIYLSPLNYYRIQSKTETFTEFTMLEHNSHDDKSIYVVQGLYEQQFLEREKLSVIYRGKTTDVVVAVRAVGMIPARMVER